MKKFFLLSVFSLLLLCSNQVLASHYLGSEITYTCIGGNQYEVNLKIYVDCSAGGMGGVAALDAHSSCTTNFNFFLNLINSQPQDVTPSCPTTTTSCNGGTGSYGINLYEYSGIVTFAPCVDWVIDYKSCCRGTTPTNLANPNSQNHYVYTKLNNVNQPCNNSAQFQAPPIFTACIGDTLYQSANAFDADGDSLVYSLTNCSNVSSTNSVTYAAGFSGINPFTGSTSIDAQTGLITLVPTVVQSGFLCIKVEEFRNGAKINETVRDYLIKIQSCSNSLPKVHKINGGNIALNSNLTGNVGSPLSIDFYIYDAEAQAGTQTLSANLLANFPTATTSFNAVTSTFTVTWTPTAADVGKHKMNIAIADNNCPYLGKSQFAVNIEVFALPFVTAFDDAFFGIENTPVTGNILANDLSSSGNLIINTTPVTNPTNGVSVIDALGNLTYTPNIGFVGLDNFTYQVCDATPICDVATVYINVQPAPTIDAVNDFATTYAGETITLNIFANDTTNGAMTLTGFSINPLDGTGTIDPNGDLTFTAAASIMQFQTQISYTICNGSACDMANVIITVLPTHTIIDTIVLGESYVAYDCFTSAATFVMDTLDNAVMTFYNGSCFSLYGDNLGTDITALTSISEKKIYQITVQNGVWPGDTDDDALVNNVDLLNIGLAYGTVGVPRVQPNILWNGYLATDWSSTFVNGLNHKHADADGNGTVNADDTLAIIQNWGLSYNKNGGRNGAPIYLETDSMVIINDSIAYIPIMLADVQTPVLNIYGLAFTITYSSGLVRDSSVMVHFDPSWLGTTSVDMISIGKDFYDNELAEVAVTRIDGNNIGGGGQIGRMCFTIQDDIIRGVDSVFTFDVTNITAIDNNAETIDIQGVSRDINWETILGIANNTTKIDLSNNLKIYPNPASDYLNIQTKGIQIEAIEVYDLTGRQVLNNQNLINNQLEINALSNGMYIVHIKTNLGVWNEKITVLK
jgi:hypothetical protein